jgi:hypothetical protein
VDYYGGSYTGSVIAADFNLDGKLDLVTASNSEALVAIFMGNGDGTFKPAVGYDVTSQSFSVVTGDFNHDGKPDLAVANLSANTVSILLGNGDGTFQTAVDYPTGNFPYGVATGDFNGDGIPDLAVSNTGCYAPISECPAGTVSVLLGNGDGTFQPNVDYLAGFYPQLPAEAELSGEGGVDLAVPNFLSNTVSVLLNLPVISVFPNSIAFGNEAVGKKIKPHSITIANPSGTPMGISSIKIAGTDPGDFAQTNSCPVSPGTLSAGATCAITVTFTPAASGKRSGKIEVTDTAPGSPQSITLTGNGT